MSARVRQLKETYIVETFYKKANNKEFRKYNVETVPTIIVFNQGKEVKRFEGVTSIDDIIEGVQTRKEQNRWWEWLKLY